MSAEHQYMRRWAEARRQVVLTELQQMTAKRAALLKELGVIEETFGFERSAPVRERSR